jgi:hypothetical protein
MLVMAITRSRDDVRELVIDQSIFVSMAAENGGCDES